MIPYSCPKAQYLAYQHEIDDAIRQVLDSGSYILGKAVETFEHQLAGYLNIHHTIGVANGTEALFIAMKGLNIGPGDEVIAPSHTADPTIAAILMTGATPVFVDIEPTYYTLSASDVAAKITKNTKAVIAVHLYGQAADLTTLLKLRDQYGFRLIEDCAQAIGTQYNNSPVGSFGDVACFSFFPTKNLGAIGDAGAIATNDEKLANKFRSLRQYGWDNHRLALEAGYNSRLDELQAAILSVKLKHLKSSINKRRQVAQYYYDNLAKLPINLPQERPNTTHSYHLFVVQFHAGQRNAFIEYMRQNSIICGIHYRHAAHQMPAYKSFSPKASLTHTEKIVNNIVSMPLYPELTSDNLNAIITTSKKFFERNI